MGSDTYEKLRSRLLRDKRVIREEEHGSRKSHRQRTVREVARRSMSSPKLSGIYCRIVNHTRAKTVLELGTSLGINTLYLAEPAGVQVTTFEGSPAIADMASLTFEFAGAKNIRLIRGSIDSTLPEHLHSVRRLDFVLVDANHRYKPTVKYFDALLPKIQQTSVVVIDDIHYSPEMKRAWDLIRNHKLVYASADLFWCGLLFFDPSLNKQHVILQV